MSSQETSRYTTVAIALHWVMAALILFMIWLGWNMDENEARFQLHKSIGITLLIVTVARILWRWLNPPPPLPDDLKSWERTSSHAVHMGFYALMVLVPLGGWLLVSISPFQVSTVLYGVVSWPHLPFTEGVESEALYGVIENIHSKAGGWGFIVLLLLHVGGAVKHEVMAEAGVLKRMLPGLFGATDAPAAARGYATAFGAALVLFMAIAAVPMLGRAGSAPADMSVSGSIASNWTVDHAVSEIRFSGMHDGNAFSGVFETWSSEIQFDPANLAGARVITTVDMTSAKAGKKLYDDSLRGPEWFDINTHPTARVELSGFRKTADGFEADAALTLKDTTVTVPLAFTLEMAGPVATLNATTTLSRRALDLGQGSDPGADWVSEEIHVTITGQASRN